MLEGKLEHRLLAYQRVYEFRIVGRESIVFPESVAMPRHEDRERIMGRDENGVAAQPIAVSANEKRNECPVSERVLPAIGPAVHHE